MIEENRNRIKMMEEEYQELKQLFDDRPSREEDLRMIQKLQRLVDQREEELKKAWHELKFFKLELINRENNYNKMFNANPNVGILDPFEAKTVHFPLFRNLRRRTSAACLQLIIPKRPSSDSDIHFYIILTIAINNFSYINAEPHLWPSIWKSHAILYGLENDF